MKIRESTLEDYPGLRHIAETKFGEDFADKDQFFERGSISLLVELDDTIVAYGTAGIVTEDDHPELEAHLTEKTGMLHSVAVLPEYEGRGIASALAKERVERLKALGCDSIIATAWRSKQYGVHVGRILERLGFEPVEELLKYWEGNDCVYCGDYCECDAVVYKLQFGR